MDSPLPLDPAFVVLNKIGYSSDHNYMYLSAISDVPYSTIYHRQQGRPSLHDKVMKQQYLTPAEESVLVSYFIRMDRNGYPLPVKFATSLAQVIATRRDSLWAIRDENEAIPLPGKNWATSFHKRHPELSAVRLKTIEWERHDHSIYKKCVHWFAIIGPQLADPTLRRENIYNMDETGVLLSVLTELKVLVDSAELRKF